MKVVLEIELTVDGFIAQVFCSQCWKFVGGRAGHVHGDTASSGCCVHREWSVNSRKKYHWQTYPSSGQDNLVVTLTVLFPPERMWFNNRRDKEVKRRSD